MKVNLDITLVVEDETLVKMADVLDGKVSRRAAKRAEVKDYIWTNGRDWAGVLDEEWNAFFGEESADDDLIGTGAPAPADDAGDSLEDLI